MFDVNLSEANIAYTDFSGTTAKGLTKEQIYSTLSYQQRDLRGIQLSAPLTDWDLRGQFLVDAKIDNLVLGNPNLIGADCRGLTTDNFPYLANSIWPYGAIADFSLRSGESLVVRNYRFGVQVMSPVTIEDGASVIIELDADPWKLTVNFDLFYPVRLGGTLALNFQKNASPASQVGHTLQLFDWTGTGVSPTGVFTVSSLYDWDLSRLYTTGQVTLLAAGDVYAGYSNGDGKVDATDFGTLKGHFGAAGSRAEGDANGDGKVDLADFGLLKANFGKGAAAVPEPATVNLALLGFGLVALLRSQKKQLNARIDPKEPGSPGRF